MHPSFRPLLAVLFLGLGTFTACQNAPVEPEAPAAQLVGRWHLTQTSGGIGGGTQPANAQQLREVVFGADGQAQELLNGTPVGASAYRLAPAVATTTQRTETFISYAGPQLSGHPYIAELSATTLVLSDDSFDGLSMKYQRVLPALCGNR